MKTNFNSLQEVANALKDRFSFISDFDVYVSRTKLSTGEVVETSINGGFYKMNYNGRPDGEYFFHEYTIRLGDHADLADAYSLFEEVMIQKLRWQKRSDESFAKEFNHKVDYKYDYSILDEYETN